MSDATTTEPARLEVPADIYDEALAFCNARRADKGLDPIDALPAGMAADTTSCPCASAIPNIHVWLRGEWRWKGGGAYGHDGPSRFTDFFDEHAAWGRLTLPVRS